MTKEEQALIDEMEIEILDRLYIIPVQLSEYKFLARLNNIIYKLQILFNNLLASEVNLIFSFFFFFLPHQSQPTLLSEPL